MTIPPIANCAPMPQIVPTLEELFADREEWWQWYAIDSDGRGYYYEKDPFPEGTNWKWDGGSIPGYRHDMTGADWQTCIYCRPIEPTQDDKQAFATLETIAQEVAAFVSKQAGIAPHN